MPAELGGSVVGTGILLLLLISTSHLASLWRSVSCQAVPPSWGHGWWLFWGHESRGQGEQRTLPPSFDMKSSRDGLGQAPALTPAHREPISVARKVVAETGESPPLGWGRSRVRPSRWEALPQPCCWGGRGNSFPEKGEERWTSNSPDVYRSLPPARPMTSETNQISLFYLWILHEDEVSLWFFSSSNTWFCWKVTSSSPYSFLTCMRIKYLC